MCHTSKAFAQNVTQGGQLINFKEALKLLHIDAENTTDINNLKWVIRSANNTRTSTANNFMDITMGSKTGSLLQNHLNNGIQAFNNDIVKRAKTPMVNREVAKVQPIPVDENYEKVKLTNKAIRTME